MRRAALLVLLSCALLAAPLSALTATRVTVATTATLVYTARDGGSSVLVRNAGSASVFLGDATVTTASGFELVAGSAVRLDFTQKSDTVYGIVATGTNRVDAIEGRR